MNQPSSQGPCKCPEGGVWLDCPRHAFMWDYVGQNPFKDHLRDNLCVDCRKPLGWQANDPAMCVAYDTYAVSPLCREHFDKRMLQRDEVP